MSYGADHIEWYTFTVILKDPASENFLMFLMLSEIRSLYSRAKKTPLFKEGMFLLSQQKQAQCLCFPKFTVSAHFSLFNKKDKKSPPNLSSKPSLGFLLIITFQKWIHPFTVGTFAELTLTSHDHINTAQGRFILYLFLLVFWDPSNPI